MVMPLANVGGVNASAKTAIVLTLAFLAIAAFGCGGSADKVKPQESSAVRDPRNAEAADVEPDALEAAADGELLDEYWRVSRLNGSKTGYSRMTIRKAEHESQPAFFVAVHEETRIKRFGEITNQTYTIRSLMREDGGLIAFEARLQAGGSDSVTRGAVAKGRLRVVTQLGGEQQIESVPWEAQWGGVGAADLMLKNQPMKPGEKRSIELMTPVVHQKMTIDLEALDWRDVVLPDQREMRLLRLKWTVNAPGLEIDGIQWMDSNGEIQLSRLPSLNEMTYRTDRKTAVLAEAKIADLGVTTIVKLEKPLANPRQTKRVVYLAKLKHSDPAKSFVRGVSQQVRSKDERQAEVEVVSIRPGVPPTVEAVGDQDQPPTAGDREPNSLIQSDDAEVKLLANEVDGSTPWDLATGLERLVNQRIDSKDFSQAFASAADVARNLQGDCTEHAVLLAALCRAREIPARVVVGLVYFPREQGFAYHMWNEVWVEDRWIPLDATLGDGVVGAERLKVASSNLRGASPYAAFLPVLPLLQQLELEVVSAE